MAAAVRLLFFEYVHDSTTTLVVIAAETSTSGSSTAATGAAASRTRTRNAQHTFIAYVIVAAAALHRVVNALRAAPVIFASEQAHRYEQLLTG